MNVTGGPRSAHPGKEARAALLLCLLYLSSLVVLSRGVVLETKKVKSRMKWSWKVHRDSDPRIAVIYLSTGHDMIYDMIAAIHVPVQPATRPFSNSRWQALTEQGAPKGEAPVRYRAVRGTRCGCVHGGSFCRIRLLQWRRNGYGPRSF